jgi:hypothetical protein
MEVRTYSAYGMQISSAIELSLPRAFSQETDSLPPSRARSHQPADVVIRHGEVPVR